jgi:DNA-binding XRE family transcriptional regulator
MSCRCLSRGARRCGAIDRALALRIRQRRIMLGITQEQLAELIGVTFQQAHKYEKGLNRLSVADCLQSPRRSVRP